MNSEALRRLKFTVFGNGPMTFFVIETDWLVAQGCGCWKRNFVKRNG